MDFEIVSSEDCGAVSNDLSGESRTEMYVKLFFKLFVAYECGISSVSLYIFFGIGIWLEVEILIFHFFKNWGEKVLS